MALMKLSNFLNAVAVKQPTGVWEKIIMAFNGGIQNYAWAIIVLTIVIKLILLPLDFFNKKVTLKNTKVQAEIQPEIEKIQKKYGNNKQMINQKTMELYKKHNYNVTGSCIMMLVYMALTLFVFFTLFSGLNSMAAYKVGNQYQNLEMTYNKVAYGITYDAEGNVVDVETDFEKYNKAYNDAYEVTKTELMTNKGYTEESQLTEQDIQVLKNTANIKGELATSGRKISDIQEEIKIAVVETYESEKESWLWIDNVWQSDVPWKKSLTSFNEYVSLAKISYKDDVTAETETFKLRPTSQKETDQAKYQEIMGLLESENRVNGYLIIPILAVAVNVLSMLASQGKLKFPSKKKKQEVEGEQKPAKKGGLIMIVLLPILMGYISISYNAVFALYILVSSLIGLLSTPLINFGIKKWDKLAEKRKQNKTDNKISYKR